MSMQWTKVMRVRGWCAAAALVAAAACGQIESPTAPTGVPDRSAPVPSGTQRGPGVQPPAVTPTPPSATPTPAPAPPPPTSSATGRVDVSINPNPVPFSGQPIPDIASCSTRPNTWFYDQVIREVGGAAVTVTERVDMFDGAVTARTNPSLRIAANGSTTVRTRWCSSAATAHTAQSNFSGTDANGRAWTFTGPVVRLQAR
jgi:hypothetical protein